MNFDLYRRYLISIGMDTRQAEETALDTVSIQSREAVETQARVWIRELSRISELKPDMHERRMGRLSEGVVLSDFMPSGVYRARVFFLKDEGGNRQIKHPDKTHLSMANEAFHMPRVIKVIPGSDSIHKMRVRELTHPSFKDRVNISGIVKTVEYTAMNKDVFPQIEDSTLSIPARHLEWDTGDAGVMLTGRKRIFFTCTAGPIHMPRASAILTVKILGVAMNT